MGFVGNLLGLGNSGMSYQAQPANIQQPITSQNVQNSLGQTQGAYGAQQALLAQLQGQNGLQNQSNVFGQQQGLANQLQGIAQGQGPNPAQMMLAQQTGQNISAQNALMAGQRGVGANAGLLARQAAMQGANTQQQAVGQGATLQAQQSLGALGQLGQQQQNMANLASQQAGQQIGGTGALNQYALANQNLLQSGLGQQNAANVAMQGNMNAANAQIANTTAGAQRGLLGGAIGGLGLLSGASPLMSGAISGLGNTVAGVQSKAHGGEIKPKSHVVEYFKMAHGALVPGRAHGGDNLKNDKVPAMLSPKEIILPRSITLSDDAPMKAAKFVAAIKAKHGMRS